MTNSPSVLTAANALSQPARAGFRCGSSRPGFGQTDLLNRTRDSDPAGATAHVRGSVLALSLTMTKRTLALLGAVVVTMAPAKAMAQSETFKSRATEIVRKVGVHLNASVRDPIDPDVTKGPAVGISAGLSPGRTNGWTYPVGLTMFSENLHSPNGETFALLKTQAIMAGIGYGWHFGRLSTGATLQTGFARNRIRSQGDVAKALEVAPVEVGMHVDNSALLRPQVKVEYFLTKHFTLRASADYMWLRPAIAVTTPKGVLDDRWNASNVHANVGVGWYPFRK